MRRTPVALLAVLVVACGSPAVATPRPTQTDSPEATPTRRPTETPASTRLTPTPAPSTAGDSTSSPAPEERPTAAAVDFVLTSPAFAEGEPIPARYTCDGADDQLRLSWSGVPEGTAELALIQHDPDAGGWIHWVVAGIPADATGIDGQLPDGAWHGTNDFDYVGYRGPCPPSGNHTYVTTLFALSEPLELGEAPTARQLRQRAESMTIASAQLRGTYRRR